MANNLQRAALLVQCTADEDVVERERKKGTRDENQERKE